MRPMLGIAARLVAVVGLLALGELSGHAQDLGTLDPKPLPPLSHPDDSKTPAKQLFARKLTAAPMSSHPIGFYAAGCMAGGVQLPITGDAWQVMRLSRNRNWGTPTLVNFLEQLAEKLRAENIWPGLLVGDMAQPRGGPMINGHASHQIGLDADVWFRPMPDHVMTTEEREMSMSTELVRSDRLDVDSSWSPADLALLRAVSQQPQVARIFVNPAIKKALCRQATGDRSWLTKIRPEYGHDYHFHIRLLCPPGETACVKQAPPPPGDGCDATLAWWFRPQVLHPRPNPNYKPPPPMTLARLPAECRQVLDAK